MNPQFPTPSQRESNGPRATNTKKPLRESSSDMLAMEVESRHQPINFGDSLYGTAAMAAEALKPPSAGTGQKRGFEESFPPAESRKKMKGSNELIVRDSPSSLYKQETCSKQRCAFGDLHSNAPWMIRNADLASALWSLSVQVDIGREAFNGDCSKIGISRLRTVFEACQLSRKRTRQRTHDPLIQIECDLQQPVFSDFEDSTTWRTIPGVVSENFLGLLTANTRVSFLVLAKDKKLQELQLPAFFHHTTESLGLLCQYMDPMTKEYNLHNIEDAETVEEVGSGLYVKSDGTILDLDKVYSFRFPLQFKVFAALTPIREAQCEIKKPNHRGTRRYQAELTAVNDFCDNACTHAPTVNFRQLLMTGGQSNRNKNVSLDVCDSEHEKIKIFDAAVEGARTIFNDDKQARFIESPGGSGKSRLLAFTAALISTLGHKVLLCTTGDPSVEKHGQDIIDFATSFTRLPADWTIEEKLLQINRDVSLRGHIRRAVASMTATMEAEGDYDTAIKRKLFSRLSLLVIDTSNYDFKKMASHHFNPSVILVDDAQHYYHAALFSTLTQFTSWQALILAGDRQQIGPNIRASKESEIASNSQVTAMELLEIAGTNVINLDTQYRMIPQIARFPLTRFYGEMKSHGTADSNGQKFRNVSRQYVGEGQSSSNYFLLNIPQSLSRTAASSESSFNHCNAKAIQVLVTYLLDEGVPADDIVILPFYSAQVNLISNNFHESEDMRLQPIRILTVDAFHGQEASITIVDFVQAHDIDLDTFTYLRRNPARSGLASGKDLLTPTSHIRDHRRINTALTRAKHGLVVVGQVPLFVGKVYPSSRNAGNALFLLVEDAYRRQLVHTDHNIVDEELNEEWDNGGITDIQTVIEQRERHWRFVEEMSRRCFTMRPGEDEMLEDTQLTRISMGGINQSQVVAEAHDIKRDTPGPASIIAKERLSRPREHVKQLDEEMGAMQLDNNASDTK
ncbi:MAG: hypothetical protein Q9180_003059 [Flavoplaca navasiana]